MNVKNQLVCLLIVALLILCVPKVAVASTGNYSTLFHNSARNNGNHISMARGNTPNGILNWKYTTKGIVNSSATHNGVVYVGSDDYNIYALDTNTGKKVWSYATGNAVWSSPTVANGVVYVGSEDHNVYALDANTGVKAWSYTTGDAVHSSPTVVDRV